MKMEPFPFTYCFLSSITDKTFIGLDYMSNTTGVLKESGTGYLSRTPVFIPDVLVGSVLLICLVFSVVFFVVALVCLCPVSCGTSVAIASGLSILHCSFRFLKRLFGSAAKNIAYSYIPPTKKSSRIFFKFPITKSNQSLV